MAKSDFDIPEDLSPRARRAAQAIVSHVRRHMEDASGGGCRAFYSPQEWKDRGETYGTEAELIVVYDGGDLRPYFCSDEMCYQLMEGMQKKLGKQGLFAEECTRWYAAIYPI